MSFVSLLFNLIEKCNYLFSALASSAVLKMLYSNTPHGGISEASGVNLKKTVLKIFISLFSSREGAITRAECARDLWGISAPVPPPSFLTHSCSPGVTWWWFSILQTKTTLLTCCAINLCSFANGVTRWDVFFLTRPSAIVLFFECCLYGSDGRRPTHELPVLWSNMCHWSWWWNHHGPYCSSGEGNLRLTFSIKQHSEELWLHDIFNF